MIEKVKIHNLRTVRVRATQLHFEFEVVVLKLFQILPKMVLICRLHLFILDIFWPKMLVHKSFQFCTRGWVSKFATGSYIMIDNAFISNFMTILGYKLVTNIKINSFQIFWRLFNPFWFAIWTHTFKWMAMVKTHLKS